jgi:hypothetical protein
MVLNTFFEKYCCSCTETSFDSLLRVSYIVLIKSPNKVWRLIFFAPFLIIISPQTKFGDLCSGFFFGQNILPTLFNIYAKSCGNPFGSFRYKCGQRF